MMSAYTGVIGTLRGDGGKRRGSGDARNNYQVGSPRSITHFTLNETLSGAPHIFTVYPTAATDPDGSVRGCILVLLKSHLRANRPNPNIIGLDGSCIRWMKTEDFIHASTVPSSR